MWQVYQIELWSKINGLSILSLWRKDAGGRRMIVWSIWDILGIAFWVLIILVFILVCIANKIKGKLHNIFRKNKANKESEE